MPWPGSGATLLTNRGRPAMVPLTACGGSADARHRCLAMPNQSMTGSSTCSARSSSALQLSTRVPDRTRTNQQTPRRNTSASMRHPHKRTRCALPFRRPQAQRTDQHSVRSAISSVASTSMPRWRTVLSSLRCRAGAVTAVLGRTTLAAWHASGTVWLRPTAHCSGIHSQGWRILWHPSRASAIVRYRAIPDTEPVYRVNGSSACPPL
jgi:hypothetical protein